MLDFKISTMLSYKKCEIKLCISVNIYMTYCRLPKHKKWYYVLMSLTSKINLYYHKNWEIKLCISVNIYHRLPKLGMSTHVFKIRLPKL